MRRFSVPLLVLALLSAAGFGSFFIHRLLSDHGKKHETVHLAEGRLTANKLPHYLAMAKNLYSAQNVKIKAVQCQDDREALAALESGRADVALVSPSSLILKKASNLGEGAAPVAFASLDHGTAYHLVSRENTPLADIKSLKNKSVIAGPQDSMETVFLENVLRDAGISPYETVTIITNIQEDIRLGALKAGIGHYLLLEEKELSAAMAQGFFAVKTFRTEFPSVVCVTTRKSVLNRPEALQGLTSALYMAQTWIRYHTAAETASALRVLQGVDNKTSVSLSGIFYNSGSLPESPIPRDKTMDALVKMLDRAREIPMPVNGADLIVDQFAQVAVKTINYIPEEKQEKKGLHKLKFW